MRRSLIATLTFVAIRSATGADALSTSVQLFTARHLHKGLGTTKVSPLASRRLPAATATSQPEKDDTGTPKSNSDTEQQRLEYQHGFHAGNFADVFKHVILVMLLQHMQRKNKPIGYVETHAGAGLYFLAAAASAADSHDDKTGEHEQEQEHQRGVWRLLDILNGTSACKDELPIPVASYLEIVQSFQVTQTSADRVLIYPGSPLLAASVLMKQQGPSPHLMRLYDKAPAQLEMLQNHLASFLVENNATMETNLRCDNGYTALADYAQYTSPLPPRSLILIDPPYQYGSDTDQIAKLCQHLGTHWRSARIAIWHPVRPDHADKLTRLYNLLRSSNNDDKEILAIDVYAPPSDLGGRKPDVGTGMILIQPPHGFDKECHEVLPKLLELLRPGNDSADNISQSIRIEWL